MKNYTDLTIILDRSGSMSSIAHDMEGGLKTFLETEKKTSDDTKVSVVRFDDHYEVDFTARDIREVGKVSISPRGGTALLDALGRIMQTTGERFAAMKEKDRPNRVLFMIITDGEENSSREFKWATIKEKIKHQRDVYSWDFMFLGTTEDALFQHEGLGIRANSSRGFVRNKKSIDETFLAASQGYQFYKGLDRNLAETRCMSFSFDEANKLPVQNADETLLTSSTEVKV